MTGLTWNKYSVILIDQWKEIISDIWWWILSEKFVMKHLMQTQVKRTWKPHRKTSTMKHPVLDYLNLLSKISTLETCVFEKESISIIFRPVWFITVLFTQLPWKKIYASPYWKPISFYEALISIYPLLFYPNSLFWNLLVSMGKSY